MELPLMPSRRQTDTSICGRLKRCFNGARALLFGKCFPCFISSPTSSFSDDDTFSDSSTEFEKPVVPPPPDLRLLCSYGGLFTGDNMCGPGPLYRGGENRFITVDRHCSAAELFQRLSTSLLGGRSFTLKYQLSVQGYNSLVTVVNDEDLKFLTEEYDRISGTTFLPPMPPLPGGNLPPTKPPCPVPQRRYLRVFLFPKEADEVANGILISPTAHDNESSDCDFDDDSFDDDDETLEPVRQGVANNNGSLQKRLINPPSLPQMKKKPGGSSSTSKK